MQIYRSNCLEKHIINFKMARIERIKEMLAANPHDSFLQHALALEYIKIEEDEQAKTLFENLLNEYFQTDKPQTIGLPSVAYCANELNLSPGYFGDLIKKETGKTAQDYIQSKVIDVAKERIFDESKSVSEIAYELGFKYPQHFTRLFKQRVGQSPNEYRSILN